MNIPDECALDAITDCFCNIFRAGRVESDALIARYTKQKANMAVQSVHFTPQIMTKIGLPFCKPASNMAMQRCLKICRSNIGRM